MAEFFRATGSFFTLIYKYISHLVNGILALPQLFEYVGDFLDQCLMYIPAEIVLFVFIIVLLCVLFLLIGR